MALTQVKSDGIATGAVTATQIATNAVTVDDISDGSISTDKLADDAVTADKLANTDVTAGTYGSSSAIPAITVDAQGRITSASTNSVTQVGGANGVDFNDNVKARFGTDNDLEVFHNASDSVINHLGTGDLYITAHADDSDVNIRADDGSGGVTTYIQCDGSNGQVELYHYGTQKLQTSSSGITVNGTLTADALTADGLTVDTDVLHVDSTNDRVGIGLTSPADTLHVRGPSSGTILNLDRGGSYSWKFGQSANSHLTITGDTTERFRFGPSGQLGIGGANYGTSGQVLTSQGSGSAPQWATPSGGVILASGTTSGNGGSGSGTLNIATFTGLDFSDATADSRLLIFGRTCIQENGNSSDTSSVQVQINVNGSNQIELARSRTGSPHGAYGGDFLLEHSLHSVITLGTTYRTTNVRLIFQCTINSGEGLYYGDQPTYSAFDNTGAGYQFSYILFSE